MTTPRAGSVHRSTDGNIMASVKTIFRGWEDVIVELIKNAYDADAQRSQSRKEEMSVANDTRVQGWKLIDDAAADMRKAMTKKYGVEF